MEMNYEDIQRVYRLEKTSPVLQLLPDGFYNLVGELLGKLEKTHRSHVLKLVKDIRDRRKNKLLLHLSKSDSTPENSLPDEEKLYKDLLDKLKTHKTLVDKELKIKKEEKGGEPKKEKLEILKVKLTQALPAIIGVDEKHYGPYKEDDIAELPVENARILIQQEVAAEV